jgi:hypothetical protein
VTKSAVTGIADNQSILRVWSSFASAHAIVFQRRPRFPAAVLADLVSECLGSINAWRAFAKFALDAARAASLRSTVIAHAPRLLSAPSIVLEFSRCE